MTTTESVPRPPYDWEQERQHAVGCRICCQVETWALSAICESCAADEPVDPDDAA